VIFLHIRFAFREGKTEFLPPDEINLVAANLLLIPQIGRKVKPIINKQKLHRCHLCNFN